MDSKTIEIVWIVTLLSILITIIIFFGSMDGGLDDLNSEMDSSNKFGTSETDNVLAFAVVGTLISAIGITGGFIYNARSINQNTKTHYYQIQKDITKEYHELMVLQPSEDTTVHTLRILNFSIFLTKLVDSEIMDIKHLFPFYDDVFSEALWIRQNIVESDRLGFKEEMKLLDGICIQNNVKPDKPAFM